MAGTLWVSALLAEVVGYKALMTLYITLGDVAEATLGMSSSVLPAPGPLGLQMSLPLMQPQ